MNSYHQFPLPRLHLYRLVLQIRGKTSNAYSLGESVQDAFSRYMERAMKQKQIAADIELVHGDLANPNAH